MTTLLDQLFCLLLPRIMSEERSNHLPDFLQSVKLKHVKLGYHYLLSNLATILVIPAVFFALLEAIRTDPEDLLLVWRALECNALTAAIFFTISLLGFAFLFLKRPRPVYLVDFSCHRPADYLRTSYRKFVEHVALSGGFEDSALLFQERIIQRSGLGDETYMPDAIHKIPPETSLALARAEAEEVMFGAMDSLLRKSKVNPRDIGILVVNSSLFNPTPSLSAMIVNKYKLRGNILSFNLGGMGCSAGLIALDLAKDLLQVHRNTYAIVISTENITQNRYFGKSKSMLIPNCLFRVGGAAILLTNRSTERYRSKYKLRHVVRTHCGADDKAFKCVFQEQDEEGNTGVSLSKDLMAVAGGALKANITTLGPLVLPLSEQLLFLLTLVAKKLLRGQKIKPYIPDFRVAFDHFCIHAGGRAVIDEIEKNLRLLPSDVEASRMMLHRFGNTSSSSIWYELAYIEAKGRMKKGHRVWQIAFGSGFKCNSAVWVALRNVNLEEDNPWRDCIDRYPVELLPDKTTYLPPRKKS